MINGQVFIAARYGFEGVLPDTIAIRIVEQEMIPLFNQDAVVLALI